MFIQLALSLGLLLISNAVTSQSSSVLTVSPGGLQEFRQIADACPTFSWGRATGANRYKVAIFDAMESDSPDYAQQLAITDPVLQASIEAPALSWTPAADQCLEQGGSYLWFVQAITSDGSSDWSAGRQFEVNLEDSALAETVRQEVSFQLRDPAIWNQVLYDVMSKGSPIVAWGPAAKARVRETGTEPTQLVTHPRIQASTEEMTTMATFPNPSAFRVTSTRGVLFDRHSIVVSGEYIPAEGSGTRFMWYPYKAALRAGTVSADQWDDVNVGRQSIAMGSDTTASGLASTAMGSGAVAIGDYSAAMGYYPAAVGKYSTAMGSETMATGEASTAMGASTMASGSIATAMGRLSEAIGSNSTAMGNSTQAVGDNSTAMGVNTSASGEASTAMGSGTAASGTNSTAMGSSTIADGTYSTTMGTSTYASGTASIAAGNGAIASGSLSVAIGRGAVASGDYSTALGVQTRAESYNETVIGAWNIPSGGDPDDWIPTEPLFVIGNGTDLDGDSNAMVVLKNGNTGIGTSIPAVPLHVDRGADCTPDSGGYLVTNGTNSTNICFDNNEIMARNDGATADLFLNNDGGSTIIGGPLVVKQLTSPNVDYGICADLDGRIAYCGSSNRYKEKIEPLRLGIRTVEKMEPVTFKWKDRDELSLGFIAEQVAAIDPLLATYNKDGEIQGVKYPQLTAVLVNAIQEQQAEIAAQRGEIVSLHQELQRYQSLAAEVAEIKRQLATSQKMAVSSLE